MLKSIAAGVLLVLAACAAPTGSSTTPGRPGAAPAVHTIADVTIEEFDVPRGAGPHDVAPATDGTVWYTAQSAGQLGRLNPATGETHQIPLGRGSAPHGVIVGPDGAAWVTDGGQNAIVRVDGTTEEVTVFPLPGSNANLNTSTFDANGTLWFTGQNGIYGRLTPSVGQVDVWSAPRGAGPYGIVTTPSGSVYFASLAGNYVGKIETSTAEVAVLDPPTPRQGSRRVWSDSSGVIWSSQWNAGQVARYRPDTGEWSEWKLPGRNPQAYAVYVDDRDGVWLSDFGSNSLVRFNPGDETFDVFPIPTPNAMVRQLLGRPGEVWGAESGQDKLIRVLLAQTQ
jgi:virginiamycin B lyase